MICDTLEEVLVWNGVGGGGLHDGAVGCADAGGGCDDVFCGVLVDEEGGIGFEFAEDCGGMLVKCLEVKRDEENSGKEE